MYHPRAEQELLWLGQPAGRWLDAFPIGNGALGAMIFGGTEDERLALNHENLWRGVTRDRTTPEAHVHLPEIREALLSGRFVEGTELAGQYLGGNARRVQPYQPAGDLTVHLPGHAAAAQYRRTLKLASGIAEVRYQIGTVAHLREAFASAEDGVIVLRLSANAAGALSATIALARLADPDCTVQGWARADRLGLIGHFPEGITFAIEARLLVTGGTASPGHGASVRVAGADEVLVVLTLATDYHRPDPAAQCTRHLDGVALDFFTLRERHVAEHRTLFDRVRLEIAGDPAVEALPADARLRRLREGGDDPAIIARYFQYGRYLLMACSRRCDQPGNLQGVWNEELRPPWDADFHLDINLQMNYWPAEVGNLPECLEPFLRFIERTVPEAKKAARDLYNCGGIYMPITTDAWYRATPEAPVWDCWTGAAAWLGQHLWWHYEFTQDVDYLREHAYPYLKLVAEFYADYLVRDAQGRLVTVPSQSPENAFVGGGVPVSLCVGVTMDFLLIREVLEHCLQASELLRCDAKLRAGWEAILRDLPPYHIGKHGQLQEWLEDVEEAEPGHRHVSHLYGIFPGEAMTPERLPECYRAARVSLERRLVHGGGHTGWSRAWTAVLWARFCEGSLAYAHLVHLVTDFATDSLLDLHPPQIFQIEGNLGGTAAVAEMLLQSHGGVLRLLPALPPQWPTGAVTGLRARGGYTVDLAWRDGALLEARLTADHAGPCRLRCADAALHAACGAIPIPLTREPDGTLTLTVDAGQCVVLQAGEAAVRQ